jgi:hypothetical protein
MQEKSPAFLQESCRNVENPAQTWQLLQESGTRTKTCWILTFLQDNTIPAGPSKFQIEFCRTKTCRILIYSCQMASHGRTLLQRWPEMIYLWLINGWRFCWAQGQCTNPAHLTSPMHWSPFPTIHRGRLDWSCGESLESLKLVGVEDRLTQHVRTVVVMLRLL